jgi:Flp pilus assembly pilin Flp
MVAAIAAIIVAATFALGGFVKDSFTKSETCISNASSTPSTFTECPATP